jgi:hypothetical protein
MQTNVLLLALVLALPIVPSVASAAKPVAVPGTLTVKLPASNDAFPVGPGSELAGQCLICHSASMVLTQPAMAEDKWVGIIEKMRTVYGAPVPANQVKALAAYLARVNAAQQAK